MQTCEDLLRELPGSRRAGADLVELDVAGTILCLRWDHRLPLVHIVAAVYAGIGPEAAPVLARLNHDLPLPGLGWDERSGHLYFRWVVPRGHAGLTLAELDATITLVVECLRGIRPVLDDLFLPALPPPIGVTRQALVDIGDYLAA